METKNYKCTQDYLNDEDIICFKKSELYQFYKDNDGWYQTKKIIKDMLMKLNKKK